MNVTGTVTDFKDEDSISPKILLKALHESYYKRLLYYAWTIVHDKELAKDLVQEAFASYWNQREKILLDAVKVRNFLYISVKNSCLMHLRHNKVAGKYLDSQNPEPVEEEIVLDKMIRSEVFGQIYAAIDTLPDASRKISKMAYIEGLKNQEIADALGISINTVKTQKQRALQMLRQKLKPESFLTLLSLYMVNRL